MDFPTPTSKITALHATAGIEDEDRAMEVVRYLIEVQHADPTLRTAAGKTAADLHQFPRIKGYLNFRARQAKREKEA